MASFLTTLILLSLLFSGLLEVSGDQGAVKLVPTEREFDYFLLTLQWPATFCYSHDIDCTCPQNGCCLGAKYPPASGFTIHGLWPSYEDSSYPQCCTENAFDNAFNLTKISSILEDIKTYWTLLACSTTSSCHGKENMFWAHEVDFITQFCLILPTYHNLN
ncbi:ribonuclease 2-like [Bidens hawaiensis]|uniref:ribonuclease 2-like n=1 Tax=Bidens hawaiensis TaxID=980011 RepID=UPI0040497FF1